MLSVFFKSTREIFQKPLRPIVFKAIFASMVILVVVLAVLVFGLLNVEIPKDLFFQKEGSRTLREDFIRMTFHLVV